MIDYFSPLSPFMKLNEYSMWENLSTEEKEALDKWLRGVDKIGYYVSLLRKDKFSKVPLNCTLEQVKAQKEAIENWTREKGLGENSLHYFDNFTNEMERFALHLNLYKKIKGGKFIYNDKKELIYISPYGTLYPDAYLFLHMTLHGLNPTIESPEMPKASNLQDLDKPEQLDTEIEKTEGTEKDVQPT